MLPSKPRARSSCAHVADATPPPTRRTSLTTPRRCWGPRSGTVGRRGAGFRGPSRAVRELRRHALLEARIEDEQHLVARLDHRVRLGHEAATVAQHGDDQRALGQVDLGDLLAGRGRTVADLELDDLQALLLEREQMDEPVARHLVLDQAQDQVGGADRGLDAEQLEVLEVPRVVDAGDDALDEVLLLGDLADEHVVLVVAGDRDDEVRALDARALEHPQLGRVAVLHRMLELLLDDEVAAPLALDERDLLALVDELARQVPADLAAADDEDIHQWVT